MSAEIAWTEVESSNVRAVAYSEPFETLCVEFQNGGVYSYFHVGMEVYTDLVHAPSVGAYLARTVKGFYAYRQYSSRKELEENILSHLL